MNNKNTKRKKALQDANATENANVIEDTNANKDKMLNLRGMFEGATISNCTQNFIYGNNVVNLHCGKEENEPKVDNDEKLLDALLEATTIRDGKEEPLLKEQEQWYAVYRVLNEIKRYPAKMTDFREMMKGMGMDQVNPPCVYDSLKAASKKVPLLSCSVTLWQKYVDLSDVYSKQCEIADFLLKKMGF